MSLELLSIAYGISTFAECLRGRDVTIYSDNTGAEATLDKGSAKAFDHGKIVHGIWLRLAELKCGAWVERVPTADNIADLPSRHAIFSTAYVVPRTASHAGRSTIS